MWFSESQSCLPNTFYLCDFHGVVAVVCIYIYMMVLLSYEPLNDLIFALRSILAAQCIEGFRSVPRTYHSHFCHSSPMHTHIHICATLPSVTTSLESQLPYKSPLLYVTTSRSRHFPKSPLHRVSLFVDNSEDCFLASFDIYIYIYTGFPVSTLTPLTHHQCSLHPIQE